MRRRQKHLARSAAMALTVVSLLLANATTAIANDNPRLALIGKPPPQSGAAAASPPVTQAPKAGEYTTLSFGVQGGCNFSLHTDIREFGEEDGGVSVEVNYSGSIDCTSDVYFEGEAYLLDRTPGFEAILDYSDTISGSGGGSSGSSFFIPSAYDGGDELETAFAADLYSDVIWTECNDRPGARILFCEGLGTTHLTIGVGSGKYQSKKKKACIRSSASPHTWTDNVTEKTGTVVAKPSVTVEWCYDAKTGSNAYARIVGEIAGRPLIPELGPPVVTPADAKPKPFQIKPGVTAHRLQFSLTYTFAVKYVREVGVGERGGKIVYEASTSCTVSVDLTFSGNVIANLSINPCRPWLPGGRAMLDVDRPRYRTGESTNYVVQGAPPNSPVRWSSSLNGNPVENQAFYGQYTDAGGNWSGAGDPWAANQTGEWIKKAYVGDFYDLIAFDVNTGSSPPSTGSKNLAVNGGFNLGFAPWQVMPQTNIAVYGPGVTGNEPYEGTQFAATNSTDGNGGIFQDVPVAINAGDTFCGSTQVATQGAGSGASGTFVIWGLDGSGGSEASYKAFTNLPGGNAWTQIQTCFTATRDHPAIRIQFYVTPNTPTLIVDNVDVHRSLAIDGGFNQGLASWQAMPQTNWFAYGPGVTGNDPYEGTKFMATNSADGNGGIYQDVALTVNAGDTFCGSAQVASQGTGSGASGTFVIWGLDGPGGSEASYKAFTNLPGGNAWTQLQTCFTATNTHAAIRIQFYVTPNGQTLVVDNVDVH
ncbi:hypothetical protein Rhe02_04100 [Rhizocola hellebori]|uniref:CBM-cenC domain-containing protein n=1 Tax=Rhizocola hellebori TaxID=1392758 RepID=A0A8J3Q1Z7_9ACTN|nr:hypothetical protein [Rhizocola hellebori]GIH02343.1 hypothetical protein Rhe02_04100 [Rhizocola hellebori]